MRVRKGEQGLVTMELTKSLLTRSHTGLLMAGQAFWEFEGQTSCRVYTVRKAYRFETKKHGFNVQQPMEFLHREHIYSRFADVPQNRLDGPLLYSLGSMILTPC